ncbi:MAG: UPF0104 family protein, partial [Raoultibacter sp.]
LILLVVAVGLVLRYRTVWAIAMAALTFIAGGEFLFANTIKVAIPILLLTVWLFIKRDAFDRPLSWPPVHPHPTRRSVKDRERTAEKNLHED